MPRGVILKAAGGWGVIEVEDVLRELDQRKSRGFRTSRWTLTEPR
jgi:hypothetical protein